MSALRTALILILESMLITNLIQILLSFPKFLWCLEKRWANSCQRYHRKVLVLLKQSSRSTKYTVYRIFLYEKQDCFKTCWIYESLVKGSSCTIAFLCWSCDFINLCFSCSCGLPVGFDEGAS